MSSYIPKTQQRGGAGQCKGQPCAGGARVLPIRRTSAEPWTTSLGHRGLARSYCKVADMHLRLTL